MKYIKPFLLCMPIALLSMEEVPSLLDNARKVYNNLSTQLSDSRPQRPACMPFTLSQQEQLLVACYTLGNAMTTRQWRDSEERKIYHRVYCSLQTNRSLIYLYEYWPHRRHPLLRVNSSANSLGSLLENVQKKDPNHCVPERIRHDAYLLFHAIQASISRLERYKDRLNVTSAEYTSMRNQILLMAQRFDRDTKEHNPEFEHSLYSLILMQLDNYKQIKELEKIFADTAQNLRTSILLTLNMLREESATMKAQLYETFKPYNTYGWVNSFWSMVGSPTFSDDPSDMPTNNPHDADITDPFHVPEFNRELETLIYGEADTDIAEFERIEDGDPQRGETLLAALSDSDDETPTIPTE